MSCSHMTGKQASQAADSSTFVLLQAAHHIQSGRSAMTGVSAGTGVASAWAPPLQMVRVTV